MLGIFEPLKNTNQIQSDMKYSPLPLFIFLFVANISAQDLKTPTLSPYSEIKQEIGLTTITLQYARPSAKGRKVFGDLVPYGAVWRTGANAFTKIILNEACTIGGKPVEKGTYALFTIPGEKNWTIIIHTNTSLRSLAGDAYKPENDLFRFEVPVKNNPVMEETFTIQFADLSTNSCNIRLTWENTMINIPVSVDVDSKIMAQMEELLKNPDAIKHGTYFEAAQYYLHNGKDLKTALSWINAALEKSKDNFRYGLLKSKILAADGKKKEAMEAINLAYEWALKANNSNYIEQTSLFRKELERK
jgi:hypothetical protein